MDRCMLGGGGGGRSGGFGCLVCWLLGGFVGSGRVVAWLVDRLVGTPLMGAWTDGCCVNGEGAAPPPQCKPSLPRMGFLASTALGEKWGKHGVMWFGCLACWLLGWFVGLAALLLGWLAPRRWMDGWMDGWADPVLPHVPDVSESVSGTSRRSRQSLRSFRRALKG